MQTTYEDRHLHSRSAFAWVVVALVAVAVIALIAAIAMRAYPVSGTMMGYYGYPFYGFWFFPFGFVFFFIFIFFIARVMFWGGGWGWRRGYYHYGDSREILRQRYARGEITKDQFDQMMRDLEQH
ncbi:MAG: SHOCT domain-containing protein [Thaumarchaeota archaeon]|nr:SHOCT domain-containing protein [Nitrososphaerota archaeon]